MERCLDCQSPLVVSRESHRYDRSGLAHVVLEDVAVHRCPACGYFEVEIPRINDLHRALARTFAGSRGRLRGAEVRFLRKHLAWNGVEFARSMGVEPETVSRWESGKQAMNPTAERLLRLCVAARLGPIEAATWEILQHVGEGETKVRYRLRVEDGAWQAEAA